MPRGDKSKYTDKQERKADHIAESYEKRGVSEKEAESRAWATSIKTTAAARKRAAPAGARRQVIRRRIAAVPSAVRLRQPVQRPRARPPRRRRQPRANAMPSITRINRVRSMKKS